MTTELRDGDRVKITMTGVYRKPTPNHAFVVINDGTIIDPDRWAVQIEPETDTSMTPGS